MSLILNGTDGLSDVDGSASTPAIRGTDANTAIFFPAADTIAFTEGGVESMRIDSAGFVGIGTSSPSEKLSVTGNVTATGTNTSATYFHRSIAPATESNIETSLITTGNGANQRAGLFATNDYNNTLATELIFKTNATTGGASERMRINSGGALLVNRTTQVNSERFAITGNSSSQCMALVSPTTGGYDMCTMDNGNGQVGVISTSGTSTAYTTSSDYRLKENIAPMTGALATVAQLKPVTYKWKVDGSSGQGFIAHELQAVVPDCVNGEKDAVETYTDEDGNEQTKPKYQGVDTSFLVATLTAAIQELKAIVDAQAIEIAELKAK